MATHTGILETQVSKIIANLHRKAAFLFQHEAVLDEYDYDTAYEKYGWQKISEHDTIDVDAHYGNDIDITVTGPNAKQVIRKLTRAFGGTWEKEATSWGQFQLKQKIDGLNITIQTQRENVCTRKVVGKETKVIPAVEAQPERIEEVEVVEWDCGNLLDR